VKEEIWCFQLRRSVVAKAGRQMSDFLLVSDHAGHNIFGPEPLLGHLQGGGSQGRG
jgi:hypothetical protein